MKKEDSTYFTRFHAKYKWGLLTIIIRTTWT